MIEAIFIYLAIVLIHGAYCAGRDVWYEEGKRYERGLQALNNAAPKVTYRVEQAPPHVQYVMQATASREEMLYGRPDILKLRVEEMLWKFLWRILENVELVEVKDDHGISTTVTARLRVIPGQRSNYDCNTYSPDDPRWLPGQQSLKDRVGWQNAILGAIQDNLRRRG